MQKKWNRREVRGRERENSEEVEREIGRQQEMRGHRRIFSRARERDGCTREREKRRELRERERCAPKRDKEARRRKREREDNTKESERERRCNNERDGGTERCAEREVTEE